MISGKRVASTKGAHGLRSNQLLPTPIPRGRLHFLRNNDHITFLSMRLLCVEV